jgi:leucyl-tRNA synthetase
VARAPAVSGLAFDPDERSLRRKTHGTIKRLTTDLDPRVHLNTAISGLMEHVNEMYAFAEKRGIRPLGRDDEPAATIDRRETAAVMREAVEALVLMLSPFAPHMSEDLWEALGHVDGVVAAGWPEADDDAAREEAIEIPVQINGKVRGRVTVRPDATDAEIEAAALAAPAIAPHVGGKQIAKVIVARGRLVSIVAK